MPRLKVAKARPGVGPADVLAGIQLLVGDGLALPVQEHGPEAPGLVGPRVDGLLQIEILRGEGAHGAVVVEDAHVEGALLLPMDDAVADDDAGVLVPVGVPGHGQDGAGALAHVLHALPQALAEAVLRQNGFKLEHVRQVDVRQVVHGGLGLAVLDLADANGQIRAGVALVGGDGLG